MMRLTLPVAAAILSCFFCNSVKSQPMFFEDFSDGIADGFTPLSGNWQVIGEEYFCRVDGQGTYGVTIAGDVEWENYHFEFDTFVRGGVDQICRFRVTSPDDYYQINCRAGAANDGFISKYVNGVRNELVHITGYNGVQEEWHHFSIDVFGPHIYVNVDEQFSMYCKDSNDPFTNGYISLISYAGGVPWKETFYDNVIVDEPQISFPSDIAILDVPLDEGGYVLVSWPAFLQDNPASETPITAYSVEHFSLIWESLEIVAATQADTYSTVVATSAIFMPGQPKPYDYYRVIGYTASPQIYFTSEIDSGFSIDNLPPPPPVLTVTDSTTYRFIVWSPPDIIPDFLEMCLYRGTEYGHYPDVLLCQAEIGGFYQESHLNVYYYVGQYSDIHGNISDFSDVAIGQYPTAVQDLMHNGNVRLSNYPNPFNPSTVISYELSGPCCVTLQIYDISGRQIRILRNGIYEESGKHEIVWLGRNDQGREVSSGTYFCRLTAGRHVQTQRMVLIR